MQKCTSAQYFKAISILCYALILGIVIFSVIVLILSLNGFASRAFMGSTLNFAVPAIAVMGLLGGNRVAKTRLLAIKELPGLPEKINGYRAVVILRYALLEGPALFSIIAIFLTSEIKLFIATTALILMMLYYLPTRQRVIKELELSSQEAAVINDPGSVIE